MSEKPASHEAGSNESANGEVPAILGVDETAPGVLEASSVKHLVVHCSATSNDLDIGVREIHAMHLGFGWHGVGYHRVIRRNGQLEFGRPDCWIGAHVFGHNEVSLGVCLVGCDQFTDAQFKTLETVLREWLLRCPEAVVRGHCDFAYTEKTCPNFDVASWCTRRGLRTAPDGLRVPDDNATGRATRGWTTR